MTRTSTLLLAVAGIAAACGQPPTGGGSGGSSATGGGGAAAGGSSNGGGVAAGGAGGDGGGSAGGAAGGGVAGGSAGGGTSGAAGGIGGGVAGGAGGNAGGSAGGAGGGSTPDAGLSVVLNAAAPFIVPEGGTATFTVRLSQPPPAVVTLSVARASGDTSLSIQGTSTFGFSSANWNVPHQVTVAAAQDVDSTSDSAVFDVTAPGVTTASLTATERDDDGDAGVIGPRDAGLLPDGGPDVAADDFERTTLGSNWTVFFPMGAQASQVKIVASSDLGMGAGPQGFFLVNWTRNTFSADQFCEATLPVDATPGWIYMVYVRWRATDAARYGFAYNSDPGQGSFGSWIFKYDGVPSAQTRVFATAPATSTPQPGDTLRVEIVGYTLRGFHNGRLVLEATDVDPTRIANGVPGLAARWATGNTSTGMDVKVWESWRGGSL